MLFLILGPLYVAGAGVAGADEGALAVPMVQALALALLFRADTVLTYDQLSRALWDRPPASAPANLRSYAATLRTVLRRSAPALGGRLSTWRAGPGHQGGYRLSVRDGELDSTVFRDLGVRSDAALRRGDLDGALEQLGRARRLWRGRVGEGATLSSELQTDIAGLNQQLTEVTERHLALRLYRGETAGVIAEAEELVRFEPLRERPVEILVRAHSGAGNQVAALRSYEYYRTRLHEAVGADPSRGLRDLYYQVGRGDCDDLARGVLHAG